MHSWNIQIVVVAPFNHSLKFGRLPLTPLLFNIYANSLHLPNPSRLHTDCHVYTTLRNVHFPASRHGDTNNCRIS